MKKAIIALILAAALFAGSACAEEFSGNLWLTDPGQMFLVNRSDLEGLGKIEGTIYVFGHSRPDSDTVCSSIAYANLLKKLGYDAQAVTLDPINRETAYILKTAGMEAPPILEDVSGLNVIMIDHADYAQSASGLENARIVGVIDHHGAGTISTGRQIIYDAMPLGATGTIVWMRYMNYGVPIDAVTAKVLLGSLLSDTINMKANVTTADRTALQFLRELSGIEDVDAFYREMYKAAISYEGMTDEEIYNSDIKEYESAGTHFLIGCINAYDEKDARAMAMRMKPILPEAARAAGVDMAFAQISVVHDDLSMCYIVPSDDVAADVIRQAFDDDNTFDSTIFLFVPGFSRKMVLVPRISEVLAMHPTE